jgi:4-oxalocrotonate tautomerase
VPLIEVTMVEGRTPEQVRALISALTRAAVETIDAPLENVRVVVREVPTTHWAAGDLTIAERQASTSTETPSPGTPDPRTPSLGTPSPGRATP